MEVMEVMEVVVVDISSHWVLESPTGAVREIKEIRF